MITFALSATVLMLFAGMTFDVGALYLEKRRVQVAADAAAFGAAHEIVRRNLDYVVSAGQDDARLNGYDNARSEVTVTVNNPPVSGAMAGNNDYVEVIIDRVVPTTFMRVAGPEFGTVRGRAVAGKQPDTGPSCILALNGEASGALTFSGTSDLNAPNCAIQANSNAPDAIVSNGGACVIAKDIGYVLDGGYVQNGGDCLVPVPTGRAIPAADPYAHLVEPSTSDGIQRTNNRTNLTGINSASRIGGATVSTDAQGNDIVTLLPGYYRGGLAINGATVVLSPGLYIMDGFHVLGNATVIGTDVTIYNTGDGLRSIEIAGTATANLSAPRSESDPYMNILFFNSRSVPNGPTYDARITGTEDSRYEGVLYFPTTHLRYGGNSIQSDVWSMIISDTLELAGTPKLSVTYSPESGRTPNIYRVALVE